MNGHFTGFRPQTQKLESLYKTLSGTLAVKGLMVVGRSIEVPHELGQS